MKKIITTLVFLGCLLPLLAFADTWYVTNTYNGGHNNEIWTQSSGRIPGPVHYVGSNVTNGGSLDIVMYWTVGKKVFAKTYNKSWDQGQICYYEGTKTDSTHASGTYMCETQNAKADDMYTWTATIAPDTKTKK